MRFVGEKGSSYPCGLLGGRNIASGAASSVGSIGIGDVVPVASASAAIVIVPGIVVNTPVGGIGASATRWLMRHAMASTWGQSLA